MISKSQIKFIKSLQLKKYRKQEQCFVVDGEKGVKELMDSSFDIEFIVLSQSYFDKASHLFDKVKAEIIIVSEKQLVQLSSFETNDSVLAIVRQKSNQIPVINTNEYGLVLDDIRDPGNLGTIIRTADWFGIRKIIASMQTADFYNPKVISATMGSFTRVQVGYGDLTAELPKIKTTTYGTFMDGQDVHNISFENNGLIIIGNESQGISPAVQQLVNHRIAIPGVRGAESLNASVATAIVLDNWSRLKK